jgi:O-antigen ligase
MICPILVATAVSQLKVDRSVMVQAYRQLQMGALALVVIFLIKSGVGLTGILPETTGLAAEVMTGSVLAVVFAAAYALGVPGALRYWSMMVALPVIGVTRTVAVATGLSLPATLAPLKPARRVVVILLVAGFAFLVFQTERFQKKMFYSGKGQIQDLALDNKDLRTTGRLWMWQLLDAEIQRKPWFGHGANAQEDFILKVIAVRGQPHNDWKRLFFDYGYFGAGIFGMTVLTQTLHAWRRGARGTDLPLVTRVLFFAGASSFLVFAIIMLTDNIILYSSFFGNLHFTLLGLAYASEEGERSAGGG